MYQRSTNYLSNRKAEIHELYLKSGKGGFSLIEIMMIIALISFLGGITLFVSMDTYRGTLFHSDKETLIASLQHARALSIGNTCDGVTCTNGEPHGVAIRPADHPNSFVIFQTVSATPDYAHRYSALDVVVDANPGSTFTGLSEVVFAELSGNVITPGTVTLTANDKTSIITIGSQGQISWTN